MFLKALPTVFWHYAMKLCSRISVEYEAGIIHNDPDIAINWPLTGTDVLLSAKDANRQRLKEFAYIFSKGELLIMKKHMLTTSGQVMHYSEFNHTFVVCAYGECPFLPDSVQAALGQTLPSRVILVTSTPNDWIRSVSERFCVPIFESGRKPSIAGDWNFGIECATSELVTICHQDDLFEPDYLQTALRCINRAKDPLILFTGYRELRNDSIVGNNTNLLIKRALLLPMWILRSINVKWLKRWILRFGDPICCPTVLYVKHSLPFPLFQSGFKSDLDWEAWELLSRTRGAFVYCPKPLLLHRIHRQSETSRIIADRSRITEDHQMFQKFWNRKIATILTRLYSGSEKSNDLQ